MIIDPQLPATSSPNADGARPKVLRRPQHFSRKAPAHGEVPADAAALPAEPALPGRTPGRRASDLASTQPAGRSETWQEDGRFGITMIVVVAAINLVLALLLPLMHKPAPVRLPATTELSGSAAMPEQKSGRGKSRVTVYTEPSNGGARMDLNSLPDGYNEFSTDPSDMPPPTARSIGDEDENF